MYAIIRCGSHQYRVSAGDRLRVQRLPQEVGATVQFKEVLLLVPGGEAGVQLPVPEGTVVKARVEAHLRGPKLRILKFRRRKHSRKQMGHRQEYTEVSVLGIESGTAA